MQSPTQLPTLKSGVEVEVMLTTDMFIQPSACSGDQMDVDCDPLRAISDPVMSLPVVQMDMKTTPSRIIHLDISDFSEDDGGSRCASQLIAMMNQPPACAFIGIILSQLVQPVSRTDFTFAAVVLKKVTDLLQSSAVECQVILLTVQRVAAVFSLSAASGSIYGTASDVPVADGPSLSTKIPTLLSTFVSSCNMSHLYRDASSLNLASSHVQLQDGTCFHTPTTTPSHP
jgi:hypothetical protein